MSRIRNVALLLLVLVLAAGLASAQPQLSVTQINGSGVSQTTYSPSSGESSKAPRQGNYWDSLDETDYYAVVPYIYAVPNPQMAVGPDDIFTTVNRTIADYPNPNALGNSAVTNPYNNPPYSKIPIDNWLGITDLNTVCPTTPRSNFTCVLDNITTRYDQLQGRYIVLFTATDVPQHSSTFVLIVSKSAQFQHGTSATSQLFTAPIAPIIGGTGTGGVGSANWIRYWVPINVILPGTLSAGTQFCSTLTTGTGPFPGTLLIGGYSGSLPQQGTPATVYGPATSGCSDYFPTGARLGLDNDNIILTAPVLDMSQAPFSSTGSSGAGPYEDAFGPIPTTTPAGAFPATGTPTTDNEITLVPFNPPVQNLPQLPAGPYAGTRVVTVPKMIVYNGATLAYGAGSGGALNLADDTATGTLTGTWTSGEIPTPTCPGPPTPLAFPTPATTIACNPNGSFTVSNLPAHNAYLTSPPLVDPDLAAVNSGATAWCGAPLIVPNILGANNTVTAATTNCNPIPPIFWEPDNLRGRALATFDAQTIGGIITPIDYLVGTLITDNFGSDAGAFTPLAYQQFFIQPIVFACPATALFPPPSGVTFCGNAGGTAQVADVAQLGIANATPLFTLASCTVPGSSSCTEPSFPRGNVGSLAITNDPGLVGQSGSVTGGNNYRLFVGDQRPQQVILRDGLLYVARSVRLFDSLDNAMGTSTVAYDIIEETGPSCGSSVLPAAANGNPNGNLCALAGGGANAYSVNGVDILQGSLVLETYWLNGQNTYDSANDPNGYGFYAAMYDVPADVIGQSELTSANTPLAGSSPISPINLFPWLEKLFVGMTTGETTNLIGTFGKNTPSLWDFRPGDDVFDTPGTYLDPYTGVVINSVLTGTQPCPTAGSQATAPVGGIGSNPLGCPIVPFGPRGSAATDPNDGSLWLYGEFAKIRDGFVPGPGHWGTSVANYQLDFPLTDPYGNDNTIFADVPTTNAYFTWIEIAKNVGLAGIANGTVTSVNCPPSNGTNPPILAPPASGSSASSSGAAVTCLAFGPDVTVTRSEMARWVVLSQMDEGMVNVYLAATGGFPGCNGVASTTASPVGVTGSTAGCNNGTISVTTATPSSFSVGTVPLPNATPGAASCSGSTCTYPMLATSASFADAPVNCSGSNTSCSYPGYLNDPFIRYIEILYRRGYTKGCQATDDPIRRFCGNQFLTRAQMAVFIIRAKMNNVFPTSLSGINLCITQSCGTTYGDNFGVFLPGTPYFPVDANGTSDPNYGDYYIFIQKLRELRITNGVGGGAFGSGTNITRKEVATFVVRAFFL